MASIAVLIPTSAMIPKAMIATVSPVRSLLLLTVRKARDMVSANRIDGLFEANVKIPDDFHPGISHQR
jgi:hypothetical protein